MTFEQILPNFKKHEYIRRKEWSENNVAVLGDDNETIYYFKVFKDEKLPISGPYSLFPICEDDDWSNNEDYDFSLPEILSDDWELLDETNLQECGFLMRHLNKATQRQFIVLMAIKKMEEDFEKMPYEEKVKMYEKYPDLIKIVK